MEDTDDKRLEEQILFCLPIEGNYSVGNGNGYIDIDGKEVDNIVNCLKALIKKREASLMERSQ